MPAAILAFLRNYSILVYAVYIVGFVFIGTFLYWRSVRRRAIAANRHFPADRVLDMIVLTFAFSLLLGRLFAILAQPALFGELRWFWIPYEKIGNDVFWFASFPWVFLNIPLGGLLMEGILLGAFCALLFFPGMLGIELKVIAGANVDFCWQLLLAVALFYSVKNGVGVYLWVLIAGVLTGVLVLVFRRFFVQKSKKWVVLTVEAIWKIIAVLGLPIILLLWGPSLKGGLADLVQLLRIVLMAIGLGQVAISVFGESSLLLDKKMFGILRASGSIVRGETALKDAGDLQRYTLSYKNIAKKNITEKPRGVPARRRTVISQ